MIFFLSDKKLIDLGETAVRSRDIPEFLTENHQDAKSPGQENARQAPEGEIISQGNQITRNLYSLFLLASLKFIQF